MTTLCWPRPSAAMGRHPKPQGFQGMAANLQCCQLGRKVGESRDSLTVPTLRHYRSGYPSASCSSAEPASISRAPHHPPEPVIATACTLVEKHYRSSHQTAIHEGYRHLSSATAPPLYARLIQPPSLDKPRGPYRHTLATKQKLKNDIYKLR